MRKFRTRVSMRQAIVAIAVCAGMFALLRYICIEIGTWNLVLAALSTVDGHSTVYAAGYREFRFRSIYDGMTESQVEELLGAPLSLRTYPIGQGIEEQYWRYSRGYEPYGSHWMRIVVFRDGCGEYKITDYYFD